MGWRIVVRQRRGLRPPIRAARRAKHWGIRPALRECARKTDTVVGGLDPIAGLGTGLGRRGREGSDLRLTRCAHALILYRMYSGDGDGWAFRPLPASTQDPWNR